MITLSPPTTLPEKHALVLSALRDAGAATSAEVEIKSGLIGGNVERVLHDLRDQGLVDYRSMGSGADSVRIYYRTS